MNGRFRCSRFRPYLHGSPAVGDGVGTGPLPRTSHPLVLTLDALGLALVLLALAVAPATGQASAVGELSAAEAQRLIEGPQAEAGEEGLGDLGIQELMDEHGVPGVSVAVIHDFEIHWAKGYGTADVETGRPVDRETMFQAASISKPVAAMGVMIAVQDGLFGLDDDINGILTSWTLDGEGFTERRPVTPRALTSHTSGLGDGFGFPGYDPGVELPTTVQILDGHELSNVGPVFMEREPMSLYEYSGGGVTVMQLALSDARGRPFEDVLHDDVLEPIGMTRSSYRQPIAPEHDANAARAHGREGESLGPKWHVYPEQAAAGLWTTPSDLARFVIETQRALRGDGVRVISRASAMEMTSPVGVGPYAVGFGIQSRGQGWYFGHGGSNWGFRASILGHRVKGYGYAIMTNATRGSAVAAEIARRIERAYEWDSVSEGVSRGYAGGGGSEEMAEAARALLEALTDEQRAEATFPFEADERFRFHFIPPEMFPRAGVTLGEMSPEQRERAHGLLAQALSREGHLTVRQIMELEDVLQDLESGGRLARDSDEYYVTVFGEPGPAATWGWRFEGHHLSLHFTIVDGDAVVFAPAFAGANPAEVRDGPLRGRRVLGDREDAGRALILALDGALREEAIIDVEAPRDIVTGAEADIDPLGPAGVEHARMTDAQRELLYDLVDVYLGMMSGELQQRRAEGIRASDIDRIAFAWAGSTEPGEPHYYRVQGPTFLIEYDNTQNGANHVHSVWRDFDGDFGRDLLREHRARDHGNR